MAIEAAAAGFIEVMSAILLTLFINPHPSDQPTNQATTTYTVTQSISYQRQDEEEEEVKVAVSSALLHCCSGLKELFCASHGFRSTFPDRTMFPEGVECQEIS